MFAEVASAYNQARSRGTQPDLLVCRGRYFDSNTGTSSRATSFKRSCFLDSRGYRRTLFFGSTPPHQATVFCPGLRRFELRYSTEFRLSADLDYFLRLSNFPSLHVQTIDLELVHMGDGGVSGQYTLRRLFEVSRAYFRTFLFLSYIPFIFRYFRRLSSLV